MKVKIILEGDETQDEAQELLVKALEAQTSGETHVDEFEDPVMKMAADELKEAYAQLMRQMVGEIEELIELEVS